MPTSDQLMVPSTEQQQHQRILEGYTSFKHNTALALLIGAPVLIALPPRKLDLFTFSLVGAFCVSANHLTRERTGRSILQHLGTATVQRQERQQQHHLLESRLTGDPKDETQLGRNGSGSKLEEKVKEAWRGGQGPYWKEQRLREEQEKLDSGEGYADMIMDQIWDVWNQKKNNVDSTKPGKDVNT